MSTPPLSNENTFLPEISIHETMSFIEYIETMIRSVNGQKIRYPLPFEEEKEIFLYNGWISSIPINRTNKTNEKISLLHPLRRIPSDELIIPEYHFKPMNESEKITFFNEFSEIVNMFPSDELLKEIFDDIKENEHSQKHLILLDDFKNNGKTKSCSVLQAYEEYKDLNNRIEYYNSMVKFYFEELKDMWKYFNNNRNQNIPWDIQYFIPFISDKEYRIKLLPTDVNAIIRTKNNEYYRCDTIIFKFLDCKWVIQFKCLNPNCAISQEVIHDLHHLYMVAEEKRKFPKSLLGIVQK